MATVEFTCEHCERMLKVQAELAGSQAKCPGCGEVIEIPLAIDDLDERSPHTRLAFGHETAAVPLDDVETGRKAQPRAHPHPLGGKNRIEDPVQILGRNPASRVAYPAATRRSSSGRSAPIVELNKTRTP